MSDRSDEDEGENNPQVFVTGDRPAKFFLHESLTHGQQEKLERDITDNGGILVGEAAEADTVLVDHESYDIVVKRFDHSKTVWVEKPDFVGVCLKRSNYKHAKPIKKSFGGRPEGARVQARSFTAEEDYHLAEYLACRIPDPAAGGRKGYGVYRELCDPERRWMYPWAITHSVDTWRNRYRYNLKRFDEMIEKYLKKFPPHPDGKGEYQHDRRVASFAKRTSARHRYIKKRKSGQEDEESEKEGDRSGAKDGNEDEVTAGRKTRTRTAVQFESDEASGSHSGAAKRRRTDEANARTPPTPEQARRGRHQLDSAGNDRSGSQLAEDTLDYEVNIADDDGYFPSTSADLLNGDGFHLPEAGPSNTQATLVATENIIKQAERANVPVEVPSPSTTTGERRAAARNRERSAAAKAGATGRTVLQVSPLKDTQATLVATQRNAPPSPPTQRRRELDPTSGNADDLAQSTDVAERGQLRTPTGDEVERRRVTEEAGPAVSTSTSRMMAFIDKGHRKHIVPQSRMGAADAPYRNTRARSRSIEPMPPPPPPVNRRKNKAPMHTVEERDEEIVQGRVQGSVNMVEMETRDEQQSMEMVEMALFNKEEGEEEHESEEEEEEEAQGEEEESEEESRAPSFFRERARHIEQKDLNVISSTPQQTPASRASFGTSRDRLSSTRSRFKAVSHRTDSSEGEFPTPGTRSKNARVDQEQEERMVEFHPTPGTRAEEARAGRLQPQIARLRRVAKKTAMK